MALRLLARTVLLALVVLSVDPPPAFGGSVAGHITLGGKPGQLSTQLTGNTSSFFLWSNLTGPVTAGPNADLTLYGVNSQNEFYNIGALANDPKTIMRFGTKVYPDVPNATLVDIRNIPKPEMPKGAQRAQDTSSATGEDSRYYYVEAGGSVSQFMGGGFTAYAHYSRDINGNNAAMGSAASITYDPGQLTGPSSGYFALNYIDDSGAEQDTYLFSGHLSLSNPGDFGSMEFMALDSRVGPTQPSDFGDPANNLWTLTITADKPVTSVSDLSVVFQINPLATVAGGGSANLLTDANGSPLSPGAIESRILGALSVNGGVAKLAPVDPFPVGTEYHVPAGTTITYGVADGAAITATAPQPPSAVLLALGALGFLLVPTLRARSVGTR